MRYRLGEERVVKDAELKQFINEKFLIEEFGLAPGPRVEELKEYLVDQWLEGRVKIKDDVIRIGMIYVQGLQDRGLE